MRCYMGNMADFDITLLAQSCQIMRRYAEIKQEETKLIQSNGRYGHPGSCYQIALFASAFRKLRHILSFEL